MLDLAEIPQRLRTEITKGMMIEANGFARRRAVRAIASAPLELLRTNHAPFLITSRDMTELGTTLWPSPAATATGRAGSAKARVAGLDDFP